MSSAEPAVTLDRDGYLLILGAMPKGACRRLIEIAWTFTQTLDLSPNRAVAAVFENNFDAGRPTTERISKLFGVHADPEVVRYVRHLPVAALLGSLVGRDVDVFLSQFVFKLPGAYGQPPHQDAPIFPFDPPGPVIGIWVALTDSRRTSSCLQLVPGSHHRGVLRHERDPSHKTGGRYVALAETPGDDPMTVELDAGDALGFDSRLVHASTDNEGEETRLALALHFATAGTVDRSREVFAKSFHLWRPILRAARPTIDQL